MITGLCTFYVQTKANQIYCCGWNAYGQLGTGNTNDLNVLTEINFNYLWLIYVSK